MMGLGIGVTQVAGLRAGGFSPAALFGNGEKGYVSDLATMFQDAAGVVPATAPGQLVAFGRGAVGGSAAQPVLSKRPIYAVEPKGGRRNALLHTESMSNGVWRTFLGSKGAETTGPGGAPGAMIMNKTAQYSTIYQFGPLLPAGVVATGSVWIKRISGPYSLSLRLSAEGGYYTTPITITNEWALYTATHASNGVTKFDLTVQDANAGTSGSFVIWHPQLELGAAATAYQRVVTPEDVTEAGVQSLPYLYRDGDDSLPATVPNLGTNATVWYATAAGAVILTGQTVGAGTFETLRGESNFVPAGVINRALTPAEAASLTAYMAAARGA